LFTSVIAAHFATLSSSARTRLLLVLVLLLGLAGVQGGRSTLAYFTSSAQSASQSFQPGVIDIAGQLAGSTASTLPGTAFSWTSTGTTGDCATVLPSATPLNQNMVPGEYCVHKVTVQNDNLRSLDAWMRIRLVRQTAAGSAATEALNNRLRVYLSEYTAGSGRTAAQYQTADCTAASFKPVPPIVGEATSDAVIANVTSAVNGNRTALTTLGAGGKNVGKHPGVAIPTSAPVTALLNSGLALSGGTGSAPTETTMSTNPATASSYNAYNLVGNDEISNPKRSSLPSVDNGTRPGGTNTEAELLAQTTRYYCIALYFPSDTAPPANNLTGDNAASDGSVTYHLVVSAAQKAGRTVD
jgi:predicted ribosomally synthesized peptide with SipW-like signal peptide